MRDPDRIDPIIEQLRAYWHANPDMRLGQIVSGATYLGEPRLVAAPGVPDPFYLEDGAFLDGLLRLSH